MKHVTLKMLQSPENKIVILFLFNFIFVHGLPVLTFMSSNFVNKTCCLLKGHAYLNNPASFQMQVCLSMYDLLLDIRR